MHLNVVRHQRGPKELAVLVHANDGAEECDERGEDAEDDSEMIGSGLFFVGGRSGHPSSPWSQRRLKLGRVKEE